MKSETPRTDASLLKIGQATATWNGMELCAAELSRQLERELDHALADKRRMDWLCDKSKVYSICIQTQPHGETIHGELRAAIDAAAMPNEKLCREAGQKDER